jgi:hypothetical protein
VQTFTSAVIYQLLDFEKRCAMGVMGISYTAYKGFTILKIRANTTNGTE